MSIDPNKSFGMKAANRSYTLEFKRDAVRGTTEVTVVDMESPKMSFGERLKTAWSIFTGKKTLAEQVFPIHLRNSDFYHLSYIYRPKEVAKEVVKEAVKDAADTLRDLANGESPKNGAPKKARSPKKASEQTAAKKPRGRRKNNSQSNNETPAA